MPVSVSRFRKDKLVLLALAFFTATVAGSSVPVHGQHAGKGKGLIRLPVGETARLTYVGAERWHDNGKEGVVDAGDVFEGIAIVTSISGAESCVDFSHQLKTRELTVAFQFTVTDGAHDEETGEERIEFSLLEGDYFRLYVGTGNKRNYSPCAPNPFERATDGQLWIAIEPGVFFKSVNEIQDDGSTLNRTWTDLTTNQTRFSFLRDALSTDPTYFYGEDGEYEEEVSVQLYFQNFISGWFVDCDAFTFHIRGDIYVEAGTAQK